MGFQAEIILWDFFRRQQLNRFKLHKVRIQCLDFSATENYLASVGGKDDQQLAIWDLQTGKAVCGKPVGPEFANAVKFFNNSDDKLVTVANNGFRIWTPQYTSKRIDFVDCSLGNIRRNMVNLIIDETDQFAYAGTKSGDLMEFGLDRATYKRSGPVRTLFGGGINCMALLSNGDMIIGSGDGTLAKVSMQNMQVKAQNQVLGAVTSISLTQDQSFFFCGTSQSNIYWVDTDDLYPELRNTCHNSKINDLAFPLGYSELFATCSISDIRIWNARSRQELLRIQVPNVEAFAVGFMADGRSIVSGWNDGKIRAFLPQSGQLMYVINDAHNHGCTAIAATSDSQRLVSGGMEGEIRIWRIGRQTQALDNSMKEHKGRVWDIQIKSNNTQAISASADGSCIVWDLNNFTRLSVLFQSPFKAVLFHPDESQIITGGTDRNITYWDSYDGQQIRTFEGSEDGEITTLAISKEGEHFVSGGADACVKVWSYDEGCVLYEGIGHAGEITKLVMSPDQKQIISCDAHGSILIWDTPTDVLEARSNNF